MPAPSAMRASRRLSRQLPDQRSGTSVTARPDEQLTPNSPICRRCGPYMAMRLRRLGSRANTVSLTSFTSRSLAAGFGRLLAGSIGHGRRIMECRARTAGPEEQKMPTLNGVLETALYVDDMARARRF